MFRRAYRLRLWSEPKKSGKTFIAALLVLWWAFTHAHTEIILAANDAEQSQGRVFKTVADLLKANPALGASATILSAEIRLSNGTPIMAIAGDYKGAAGSRHSLYMIDEPAGIMEERAVRLVEELTPPPSEPDAWGLITGTAGWIGDS
jgi:phage terminase large subunit-like protein